MDDPTKNYPNLNFVFLEIDYGWLKLVDVLFAYANNWNSNNNDEKIEFHQVKEKYGSLRIYYTGGSCEFDGMVKMAELLSNSICEKCGAFTGCSYIYTDCAKCRANNGNGWGKTNGE